MRKIAKVVKPSRLILKPYQIIRFDDEN